MMYTFCGVTVTEERYHVMVALLNKGTCPFCHNKFSAKYGNMKKHIRACESRKKEVRP